MGRGWRRSVGRVNVPPAPVGGPSWAAVPPADALTAGGLAARLGAYCWVEQQLFSLLGGWVVEVADHDVKALLVEVAEHAAWRALRWYELLPTAPPGADALVRAPEGVGTLAELVAGPMAGVDAAEDRPRAVTRLACASRVLMPRLLAAYTAHLDWSTSVAEASVRRVLAIAVDDLGTDLRHAERLTQMCLDEATLVTDVTALTSAIERSLVAVGGLLGPAGLGSRPL